ncbi:MAG TPA: GspE/PulE family protein [Polyangiaceae bacterium]|nr:GspE/PulE family protein [Polyangiaceae bacterium]
MSRLVLVAVACAVVGTLLAAFSTDDPTWNGRVAAVAAVANGTFSFGLWGWLVRASAVAAGLAVVLGVADAAVNRRQVAGRMQFDAFAGVNVRERVREVKERVSKCIERPKPDIIAAFDELVRGAIAVGASDIHMSPTPQGYKLTYRVLGSLHDVTALPLELAPRLTTRVKVLARLDTYVRGTPQDGRLVMTIDGALVEARTSTLPTETGERIVLRFVRGATRVPELDALGFSEQVVSGLKDVLVRPQGLFFVTAPVGSGKTTTLYGAMTYIAASRGSTTSLVTLEDPIELELPFATQTQMHPKAGMTFASTLRSVLRQDPNVLMLGEIRDHETADIAMQAGLTGHLILTTVHGDSAAGPFARIIDMNVEPFIIASATIGCLSQRLVRTLCMNCRKEAAPEPLIVERFGRHGVELPKGPYFEPAGCDYCEGLGFTGRRPIAELLVMDAAMRKAVSERRTTKELHDLAVKSGMTPLLLDGLSRARSGETSLSEALRVAG